MDQPLDVFPLSLFFLLSCLIVWGSLEGGYRLGRWRHLRAPDEKDSASSAIVGSILGLLAFLLAFTFGMGASRFEDRRKVVVREANAIGTTYLRTRLLDEPIRKEVSDLLREYVELRLTATRQNATPDDVSRALRRSEELHALMWTKGVEAAEKKPTPITGLFLLSLNDVIDIHTDRIFIGMRSRIPTTIWLGLIFLAILSFATTGYLTGLSESRRPLAMLGLVIAFAGVMTLIADLDRPGEGFLRNSQEVMVDLQKSMKAN